VTTRIAQQRCNRHGAEGFVPYTRKVAQAEKSPTTDDADNGGTSAFSEALDFVVPQSNEADDFTFDETTLGQSNSVFADAQVLAAPVAVPVPYAAPAPMTAAPPQMVPASRVVTSDDLTSRERRHRVRLQARKVRRIIRHIEPWSVFKISLIFYICMWIIMVLAGVLLWSVAVSSGVIESAESFIATLVGSEEGDFLIEGEQIFTSYALGALVLAIAGMAFNVLLCVLFNLISDLTGGIRMTVIEEESARFRPPRRRRR